jgi:hypothetical protein
MIAMGGTYDSSEMQLNLNTGADYINKFIEDYEDKLSGGKKEEKKEAD